MKHNETTKETLIKENRNKHILRKRLAIKYKRIRELANVSNENQENLKHVSCSRLTKATEFMTNNWTTNGVDQVRVIMLFFWI